MGSGKAFDVQLSTRWLLLIATLLALGLRLPGLASKSLWLDEANSIRVARLGQAKLWTEPLEGYHPPLFSGLLQGWLSLGESEFILRWPMAIGGALGVPLLYVLAASVSSRPVALSATWLAAVSPLLVWYSQEVRPYSWLMLVGLITMIALARLLRRPSLGWWLLFAISLTTAFYLHYGALLLLPVQAVLAILWLATGRTGWCSIGLWLAGLGTATLALGPWLRTPAFSDFVSLALSSNNYVAQLFRERFDVDLNPAAGAAPILLGGLLVGVALLAVLYLVARRIDRRALPSLREGRGLQALAVTLFAALLAASVVPRGYSLKRQLVALWPYLLLLFAWLWPWGKKNRVVLAAVLGLSLLVSLVALAAVPKDQWREATALVAAQHQPGDLAILEPAYMTIPFDYYNRGRVERVGVSFDASPDLLTQTVQLHDRVWLIRHQLDRDPQDRTQRWLGEHATLAGTTEFFRIDVQLYKLSSEKGE